MRLKLDEMSPKRMTMMGNFTIKGDYSIVCANESFYTFLGTNSYYKIVDLIHPEDRESFVKAVESIEECEQKVAVRIKSIKGTYEFLFLEMTINKKTVTDEIYIDIEYMNILFMKSRNVTIENNAKKYRRLLGFEKKYYFEYDAQTKEFLIYMYINEKTLVIVRKDFAEWYNECLEREDITEKEKNDLENFYYTIKTGMSDFLMNLSSRLFYEADENEESTVKGSIIFMEGNRKFTVGTISPKVTIDDDMNTTYYISELRRDSSTGLYNKKAVAEYVMEQISNKSKKSIHFVIIDIDDFKNINDTYGHMFGDVVILKLAEILKTTIANRGIVGRFGGDEFVMVLENIETAELRTILKTVSKNLAWTFKQSEKNLNVTLSMGIARYPDNASTYEELFRIADKCLYLAKEKGKSRFVLYEPEKHGIFVFNESGTILGVNDVITKAEKADVVSEVIATLSDKKNKDVEDSLEIIRHNFDVDAITVYVGEQLKKKISVGTYLEEVPYLVGNVDDNYFGMFDAYGMLHVRSLLSIEKEYPRTYETFAVANVSSYIQVYYNEKGKMPVLVSFDTTKKHVKRSEHDITLLSILAKYIGKVISDNV